MLVRQKQKWISEFKASLIYKTCSRTAKATLKRLHTSANTTDIQVKSSSSWDGACISENILAYRSLYFKILPEF